jgi:hypothetical protein
MSANRDNFICEGCGQIDFEDLLQCAERSFSPKAWARKTSQTVAYTHGCLLCRLLMRHGQRGQLRSFQFSPYTTRWVGALGGSDAEHAVILKVGQLVTSFVFSPITQNMVFCTPIGKVKAQGLYHPEIVAETFNHAKARSWIDTCQAYHPSSCNQMPIDVPGIHLIDCDDMTVVKATESSRWIALSYVWGVKPQGFTPANTVISGEKPRLPSELPRTVEDAICVTKQLGYRFLWVDEYCIDQGNEKQRNEQINSMDQIYRGAELTIVAAAGEDKNYGLPGIGVTPRVSDKAVRLNNVELFTFGPDPIQRITTSKWWTRAWTFQEGVLSKRLLVFTDHQTSFYCQTNSWMEGLGGHQFLPEPETQWDEAPAASLFTPFRPQPPEMTSLLDSWDHFAMLVQRYSSRHITFEEDAFNAFLGVMIDMRRTRSMAYTLYGLPFFRFSGQEPIRQLNSIMFAALSWYHRDVFFTGEQSTQHERYRRRVVFPSWTWVGWQGEATFMCQALHLNQYRTSICEIQLETTSGTVLMPSALPDWLDYTKIQLLLDSITAIHFEALEITMDMFSKDDVNWVPQDAWRSNKIANRCLDGHAVPTFDVIQNLVANVRRGVWSCFILGKQISTNAHDRFVLIVQWKEDQVTAERVGAFMTTVADAFGSHRRPTEDELGPFEEKLKGRRVRLI